MATSEVVVLDVATADPVGDVQIAADRVSAPGYVTKSYPSGVPQLVRLLSVRPELFVGQPSAAPGETVAVHLHCVEPGVVRASRWQATVPSGPGQATPDIPVEASPMEVPDEDVVRYGLTWPTIAVRVPDDAQSGIWLVQYWSQGSSAVAPLVVRGPGAPRQPILAVASVATWALYNEWGGRNRYRNFEGGPTAASSTSLARSVRGGVSRALARLIPEIPRTRLKRAVGRDASLRNWTSWPISFRRPWSSTFELGHDVAAPTPNHLAALDAKILAWLDEQGQSFECVADIDLHQSPELASGRAAILLLGHSEYWSAPMLEAVIRANQAGAWVVNLSGNSMYRQIEVADDWTLRMSSILTALTQHDETAITGVRYSERAYGSASSYVVRDAGHWIFEGLGLQNGDRFGKYSLCRNVGEGGSLRYDPTRPSTKAGLLDGEGAAGFEVDRVTRRRRREFAVVAEGDARASAHLVVKDARDQRGGLVSFSSITFGGSLLVDGVSSGIVRNVLARAVGSAASR